MQSNNFKVETKNTTERVLLSVKGNLTSSNALSFKETVMGLLHTEGKDCHIDISQVDALDLTGVNALVVAHSKTQEMGRELVILSSASNPAEELLYLTQFIDVFQFQRAS